MSLQGVLPNTQFRTSWQVVMKLALRLVWSGCFSFWVQPCYSQLTSSMEPFLFWSGPSSQTLLASNHVHNTNNNNVTCSLVILDILIVWHLVTLNCICHVLLQDTNLSTSFCRIPDNTVNIVVKANKSLGFVRRNLYPCSERTNRSAYVTIVRPNLEFATAVWDPYRQEQIDSIEAVQRRAARFIKGDYNWTSSVKEMLQSLDLDLLEDRRKAHQHFTRSNSILVHQSAFY